MTPLATLLASNPLPSPGLWRFAQIWVDENPSCLRVRPGKWESLLRVAYAAPTYSQLTAGISEHFNLAGTFGDANRWRNPNLTAALEKAIAEASSFSEDFLFKAIPHTYRGYRSLTGSERSAVTDAWKRQLALAFLRAVHGAVRKLLEGRSSGG